MVVVSTIVTGPIGPPAGGKRLVRDVDSGDDELDDRSVVVSSDVRVGVERLGGANDWVGLVVTVVVIRDGGGCAAVVVTGASEVGGGAVVVSTVRSISDADVGGGRSSAGGRETDGVIVGSVTSGVEITMGMTVVSSVRCHIAMVTPAPMMSPTRTVPAAGMPARPHRCRPPNPLRVAVGQTVRPAVPRAAAPAPRRACARATMPAQG